MKKKYYIFLFLLFWLSFLCHSQSDSIFLGGKFILTVNNRQVSSIVGYNQRTQEFIDTPLGVFKNGKIESILFTNNTLFLGGGFQWVRDGFSDSVASFEISTNKLHGTNPSLWRTTESELLSLKKAVLAISQGCVLLGGRFAWSIDNSISKILCYHLTKNEWSHFPDPSPDSPVLGLTSNIKGFIYSAQAENGTTLSRFDPLEKTWHIFYSVPKKLLIPGSLTATLDNYLYAVVATNSSRLSPYSIYYWDGFNLEAGPTELHGLEPGGGCPAPLLEAHAKGGLFISSGVDCVGVTDYLWQVFYLNGTQLSALPEIKMEVSEWAITGTGSLFIAGSTSPSIEGHKILYLSADDAAPEWTEVSLQPLTYRLSKFKVLSMAYDETYHDLYVSLISFENEFTELEYTPRLLKWSIALKRTTEMFAPAFFKSVGTVESLVSFSNGDIFVGGEFDYAADVKAHNVALWDGSDWEDISLGYTGITTFASIRDTVFALEKIPEDSICFSTAGGSTGLSGNSTDKQLPIYKYTRQKGWQFLTRSPYLIGTTSSLNRCVLANSMHAHVKSNTIYIGGNFRANLNNNTALGVLVYDARRKEWSTLPISLRNGYIDEIERFGESSDGKVLLLTGSFRFSVVQADQHLSYYNLARWSVEKSEWLPVDNSPLENCPRPASEDEEPICHFSSFKSWSLQASQNSSTVPGILAGGTFIWQDKVRRGILFYDSLNDKWYPYGNLFPSVHALAIEERSATIYAAGHFEEPLSLSSNASFATLFTEVDIAPFNDTHTSTLFFKWNTTTTKWTQIVPSTWWVEGVNSLAISKDDTIFNSVMIALVFGVIVVATILSAYGLFYHLRRKLSYTRV